MGAQFNFMTVKGGNMKYVEQQFKQRQRSDAYELGNSYSGGFNMADGLLFISEIFNSREKAYEFLEQTCQKWEEARVVQYRNEVGQLVWGVGAWCSS